jgi:hypothetical protein
MKTIADIQADFKKQITARHLEPSDAVKLDSFRVDVDNPLPGWDNVSPAPAAPVAEPSTDDLVQKVIADALVEAIARKDTKEEARLRALLVAHITASVQRT